MGFNRTSLLEVMMVMSAVRLSWLVLTTSPEPEHFKAAFELDFFKLFVFLPLRQNLHFISLFSTGRRFHVNQVVLTPWSSCKWKQGTEPAPFTKTWDKYKESSRRRRCLSPLSDGDAALHRTCLDVSYLWRRSIIAPTRTFFKEQYSCQRVRCCTDTFR